MLCDWFGIVMEGVERRGRGRRRTEKLQVLFPAASIVLFWEIKSISLFSLMDGFT